MLGNTQSIEAKRWKAFLWLAALVAVGEVLISIHRFGPGLSTDGARLLATAESLAAGRGFIDYLGVELTQWPPLYPLILAAMQSMLGLDPLWAGGYLNAILFGACVFLFGLSLFRASPGRPWLAACGVLLFMALPQTIAVFSNIASDPPFLFLVLLFVYVASDYPQRRSFSALWMLITAIFAGLLRYAGLALCVAGVGVLLFHERANWKRGLKLAAAYLLHSVLPLFGWGLLHNVPISGHLFGAHMQADPIANLGLLLEKPTTWLLPERLFTVADPLVYAFLGLGACLWLLGPAGLRDLSARLTHPDLLPHLSFAIVYGGMLIFAISTAEHSLVGNDRIHLILLPSAMILVLASIGPEISRLLERLSRPGQIALPVVIVIALLLHPVKGAYKYLWASAQDGDVSKYNIYNRRSVLESDLAEYLQSSSFEAKGTIYSNNEGAAWFLLRQPASRLPDRDQAAGENSFDPDPGSTAIWFTGELDYKQGLVTQEELSGRFLMQPLGLFDDGEVFSVSRLDD